MLDFEHWKRRTNTGIEMRDFGNLWKEFICYNNEPFLSHEEGYLGLILNYDHFQPYDHISYSMGAIYISVLNLPRKIRYKRENMILVGLIPGPYEPEKIINTFLEPLVEDLHHLWKGVDMNIPSIKTVKKVRCALLCVACDMPADQKFVDFFDTLLSWTVQDAFQVVWVIKTILALTENGGKRENMHTIEKFLQLTI